MCHCRIFSRLHAKRYQRSKSNLHGSTCLATPPVLSKVTFLQYKRIFERGKIRAELHVSDAAIGAIMDSCFSITIVPAARIMGSMDPFWRCDGIWKVDNWIHQNEVIGKQHDLCEAFFVFTWIARTWRISWRITKRRCASISRPDFRRLAAESTFSTCRQVFNPLSPLFRQTARVSFNICSLKCRCHVQLYSFHPMNRLMISNTRWSMSSIIFTYLITRRSCSCTMSFSWTTGTMKVAASHPSSLSLQIWSASSKSLFVHRPVSGPSRCRTAQSSWDFHVKLNVIFTVFLTAPHLSALILSFPSPTYQDSPIISY